MLAEQSHWNFNLTTATLNDVSVAADVSIIASHGYFDNAAPYSTAQVLGKRLWETEDSTFDSFNGSIANGLFWAQRVSDWMTIANANAWHYWWLVDGGSGDNQALSDNNGNLAKRGYAVGNFSKFVRPGWVRIDATPSPASGVSVSAYKDASTGQFAFVAINHNTGSVPVNFVLSGFTAKTVTVWETSATLNLAQQASISVGGGSSFSATLSPSSVTTFVGP
jgi:glucuronoarabinoxylan endo-1,4-beta-xylanase